jgi:cytochrome c peroxidase
MAVNSMKRFIFFILLGLAHCIFFTKCNAPNKYKDALATAPENLRDSVDTRDFLRKASVGHFLFFDPALSINGTKSCASCHNPSLYFTDGYRKTLGVYADVQLRNTPSLLNLVNAATLNWADPHTVTFQQQMQVPLFSKAHFVEIVSKLGKSLGKSIIKN